MSVEDILFLQRRGVPSPCRAVRIVRNSIASLELDLSGLIILTEAGSGHFLFTPIIAAVAGAEKVYAITRDSRFGSAEHIVEAATRLASMCHVSPHIEFLQEKIPEAIRQADMITNLGFVRPIDRRMIDMMKPSAVIPLMCEAWEWREGDIDAAACKARGIPIVDTNEDYPGLEVFANIGWLCCKMLLEGGIEIYKSKVMVVGRDKFASVIHARLAQAGAGASRYRDVRKAEKKAWEDLDALVVADYTREDTIIGPHGDMTAGELSRLAPGITVIHFAGRIDRRGLRECAIPVFPPADPVGDRRMIWTLADLGPRPVIELHAAGLKAGQMAIEFRNAGADLSEWSVYDRNRLCSLVQGC